MTFQKVSFFIIGANLRVTVKKKDMDIRDQKPVQLLRKINIRQVKPRSLKVLQQRIEDITYYTLSTFVGYTSGF